MSGTTILIVLGLVVVVVAVLIFMRSRSSNDGVDSFRRQIDALSPEARRPVVDQVQSAAGRNPAADEPDDEVDDDAADEDGARGT